MLISKQKLYTLLEVINDKLTLLPSDSRLYIDPKHDLKGYFPEEEIANLLLKLQNDEKVLKVIQWPPTLEYREEEKDTYFGITIDADAYKIYLRQIQSEPEYQSFKNTPVKTVSNNVNEDVVLWITYTDKRIILLNDFFVLSNPNFDNENDLVFNFLYQHPNKKYTNDEIKKAIGANGIKPLHKIVENLRFTHELKRIFFDVSKNAICFRNPITKADLMKIGITHIKLPR